jgi:hypothetical protein
MPLDKVACNGQKTDRGVDQTLDTCFASRRPEFNSDWVHVVFMVDEVVLEQISLQLLLFSPASTTSSLNNQLKPFSRCSIRIYYSFNEFCHNRDQGSRYHFLVFHLWPDTWLLQSMEVHLLTRNWTGLIIGLYRGHCIISVYFWKRKILCTMHHFILC